MHHPRALRLCGRARRIELDAHRCSHRAYYPSERPDSVPDLTTTGLPLFARSVSPSPQVSHRCSDARVVSAGYPAMHAPCQNAGICHTYMTRTPPLHSCTLPPRKCAILILPSPHTRPFLLSARARRRPTCRACAEERKDPHPHPTHTAAGHPGSTTAPGCNLGVRSYMLRPLQCREGRGRLAFFLRQPCSHVLYCSPDDAADSTRGFAHACMAGRPRATLCGSAARRRDAPKGRRHKRRGPSC